MKLSHRIRNHTIENTPDRLRHYAGLLEEEQDSCLVIALLGAIEANATALADEARGLARMIHEGIIK